MVVDVTTVGLMGGGADFQPGIIVEPGIQPLTDSILPGLDDIQSAGFLKCTAELFFGFRLGFAKDILVDALSGGEIVSCGIASLPTAAIFSKYSLYMLRLVPLYNFGKVFRTDVAFALVQQLQHSLILVGSLLLGGETLGK